MRGRPHRGRLGRGLPARRGALGWVALAGLGLLIAGCAGAGQPDLPQNVLDPAGPIARAQDRLWDIVFPIAVVVFVIVQGLIIFAVVKFRDRGQEGLPKQVHGNTRLEIAWTIVPALILVMIAIPTVSTIFQLSGPASEDALMVRVVGKQYWWQFEYLNATAGKPVRTASELHIPTGREVFLELEGRAEETGGDTVDVIHSFWVPRLAGKQDYVPGHQRTMRIIADQPGTYSGQCAEFCGLAHAEMRFAVIAHEPAQFAAWIAAQQRAAATPAGTLARRGEALVTQQGCMGCHTIDGHPQNADLRIGPSLTHFAERAKFAGYSFERNDENLKAWIRDPQSLKLGAQMPRFGNLNTGAAPLSEDELDALVAYLQSLE